jgi:TonB family protein
MRGAKNGYLQWYSAVSRLKEERQIIKRILARGVFLGLVAACVTVAEAGPPPPAGNFHARIRANDAPTAGRLTINAWLLDTLDTVVELPGPGRVLAVEFTESNGKNSFVVPVDLAVKGRGDGVWTRGLQPLDPEGMAGFLPKDESRWALWWVPWTTEELRWTSVGDLQLVYGFSQSDFVAISDQEARRVAARLPWEAISGGGLGDEERLGPAGRRMDPAAFDDPPVILTQRRPVYPKTARVFDFEGTVNVAALVNEEGTVIDAFVVQSSASHELNMSALVAAMEWTFTPGTKNGAPASGFVLIPLRFSLGALK